MKRGERATLLVCAACLRRHRQPRGRESAFLISWASSQAGCQDGLQTGTGRTREMFELSPSRRESGRRLGASGRRHEQSLIRRRPSIVQASVQLLLAISVFSTRNILRADGSLTSFSEPLEAPLCASQDLLYWKAMTLPRYSGLPGWHP